MNQNEIDALGRHIAENAEGSAFKKPTPATDRDELMERRYLLVKRGLYYGPNNCGYTSFKSNAGRYLKTDAMPAAGVTAIHEDEAHELAPSHGLDAGAKVYVDGLHARIQADAATIAGMREALAKIAEGDWSDKRWQAEHATRQLARSALKGGDQ